MMKQGILISLILLSAPAAFPGEEAVNNHDAFGGWMELSAEPKMFFYTQKIDGVWWLIDPAGKAFISKGVNHISYTADNAPSLGYSPYGRSTQEKYGSQTAWAEEAAARLRRWGFNTIGAWSNDIMRRQDIPYTLILNIAVSAGGDWQRGIFPDVFSSEFEREARRIALTQCSKRADDIYLIGYFTDNELRWGPDWRSDDSLLFSYLKMDAESPGFQNAVQFLTQRHKAIESFNQAWRSNAESFESIGEMDKSSDTQARRQDEADFQEQIAHRYFQVCQEAIRKYDPNHLILGCRFAGYAPKPVLQGMKDFVDILSYNSYNPRPPAGVLEEIHAITGKPIMIGEFSFKAMDSGLPNTKGAAKPVQTQQERAEGFTRYVSDLMDQPYIIGYHWFEYADEPAEGRFDGENSNYGLVNIQDEPWEILTNEMTQTNRRVERMHAGLAEQAGVRQGESER